jgi:hypothetical protein
MNLNNLNLNELRKILLINGIESIDNKNIRNLNKQYIINFLNDNKNYNRNIVLNNLYETLNLNRHFNLNRQLGGTADCTRNLNLLKSSQNLELIPDVKRDCYNNSDILSKIINHPLKFDSDDEKCVLINQRKDKYYIFKYDPTETITMIEQDTTLDETKKGKLLDEIHKIFDLKIKENCCNCFTFVIYVTDIDEDKDNSLEKYLHSILISVENISNALPQYICRIYIDESVIKLLNEIVSDVFVSDLKDNIVELYNSLFTFDNVEIYTILCNDINIGKTRSYRFLPLIDEDVNIVVSREADGIVTYNDCHNINLFAESKKFLYMNYGQVSNGSKCPNKRTIEELLNVFGPVYYPYSHWLVIYIDEINKSYFKNKFNICDIYAGAVAFKLKLNSDYLLERKIELNKNISKYDTYQEDKKDEVMYMSNLPKAKKYYVLNIGFDEILLLDLFKSLISYDIKEIDNEYIGDKNEIELKLKLIESSFFSERYNFEFNLLEEDLFNKYFTLSIDQKDNINILINKFKYCICKLSNHLDHLKNLSKHNLSKFFEELGELDYIPADAYTLFLVEYIFANIIKPNNIYYICLSGIDKLNISSNYTIVNHVYSTYYINITIYYKYKDIFNFYKINYDEIKEYFE